MNEILWNVQKYSHFKFLFCQPLVLAVPLHQKVIQEFSTLPLFVKHSFNVSLPILAWLRYMSIRRTAVPFSESKHYLLFQLKPDFILRFWNGAIWDKRLWYASKSFLYRDLWNALFHTLHRALLHIALTKHLASWTKLKKSVCGTRLESDDLLKETVTNWLNGKTVDFFDEGMQKLDINGDYVQMSLF